jgi:regulator of sirC expression with transglutaminase-like and TPR domain
VNQTIDDNNIKALISLLEDTDDEIYSVVSQKLIELGSDIIPRLEKTWETSTNTNLQEHIENIIQEIQFQQIYNELRNWDLMNGTDLLKGAYIVAKYQYPELKYDAIYETVEKIRNDVWLELNEQLTALEKVKIINQIFYNTHKFSGNFSNYYSPQNYFINHVLETRKGNPVSLGIIYITIAHWLNLPIYGVNLPKNFILAYKDLYSESNDNILFYINPYNKGSVLGKGEIDNFLKQQNIKPDSSYYQPCSNVDIIERLILNIINSYESTGQTDKIARYKKLLTAIKKGNL